MKIRKFVWDRFNILCFHGHRFRDPFQTRILRTIVRYALFSQIITKVNRCLVKIAIKRVSCKFKYAWMFFAGNRASALLWSFHVKSYLKRHRVSVRQAALKNDSAPAPREVGVSFFLHTQWFSIRFCYFLFYSFYLFVMCVPFLCCCLLASPSCWRSFPHRPLPLACGWRYNELVSYALRMCWSRPKHCLYTAVVAQSKAGGQRLSI